MIASGTFLSESHITKNEFCTVDYKENIEMSLLCVITCGDEIYFAADSMSTKYVDGQLTHNPNTKKLFTLRGANVVCGAVGQLSFGPQDVKIDDILSGLTVKDAHDASEKIYYALKKYEIETRTDFFVSDGQNVYTLSIKPKAPVSIANIWSTGAIERCMYFAGADWAIHSLQYVHLPNEPERLLPVIRTMVQFAIDIEAQYSDDARSIGGDIHIVKVSRNGVTVIQ